MFEVFVFFNKILQNTWLFRNIIYLDDYVLMKIITFTMVTSDVRVCTDGSCVIQSAGELLILNPVCLERICFPVSRRK